MTSVDSLHRVERFWENQLAITPDLLSSQKLLVVPHPDATDVSCRVFQHHTFICVHVPQTHSDRLHRIIGEQDRAHLLTPAWWQQILGTTHLDVIEPAYLGYADAQQLRPLIRHPTRLLTPSDSAAFAAFATTVGTVAWEHSGLGVNSRPRMYHHRRP